MQPSPISPIQCQLRVLIAAGAGLLGVLAYVGAAMEPPGSHRSPVAAIAPGHASLSASPILQAAEHPRPINLSSRNLRLPRAPRHRSDRPMSGAADAEAVTATAIFDALGDDTKGSFVTDGARACPLAGHPLSLLRPPSLLVG